jgi:hypothetical protein
MKKFFRNIKFLTIWGMNQIYSLKDLRLDTPISGTTFLVLVVLWFLLLNYFFLF